MKTLLAQAACAAILMIGNPNLQAETAPADARSQVIEVERAFAQTMADRDHEAFTSFLAEDTIFLGPIVLRGRQAVADSWRPFFQDETAPFSWTPETVEVLESGELALSTGPVRDPAGNQVSVFTSIWRLEAPGVWRIVFDRGNKYCE